MTQSIGHPEEFIIIGVGRTVDIEELGLKAQGLTGGWNELETMTPTTDYVDKRIREIMASLDLRQYPSWPEPERSQALLRLIEYLPVAAFGSREIWNEINDLIIEAYKIEFKLEDEQAKAEAKKVLNQLMRNNS